MILQNKYVVGCLVQFYEIEMFPEYIDSCIQMMRDVENRTNTGWNRNVEFHFCFSMQEYLENFDGDNINFKGLLIDFENELDRLRKVTNCIVIEDIKTQNSPFYNIATYRRDLNYNWCEKVDFVLWGETDSLWPKQTLEIIEGITSQEHYPKFVLNFAGRKNWDRSWEPVTHPMFKNTPYVDTDEWILNNEASEKAYMSINRMNEINNIPIEDIRIEVLGQPKADGSCLVISTDLIKSGVNIPHALIHCGEDESFLRMAKIVMGDQFVQYHVSNILRVHNRRHPRKRSYIKGENNPKGFCDERKGDWWKLLENNSKYNLENLRNQVKFVKTEDVIYQIQSLKK